MSMRNHHIPSTSRRDARRTAIPTIALALASVLAIAPVPAAYAGGALGGVTSDATGGVR